MQSDRDLPGSPTSRSCWRLGGLESGRRDSNSRLRPWEGRTLPTELLPLGKGDSSIAFPQLLAHWPDDRDQLCHPCSRPLDAGGVEDLHGIGFVQPQPAPIPWLQVELLPQTGFEHEQLPGQAGRDPLVDRRLCLEVEAQLETAGVRMPPGLEMQPRVVEEPLRLARAGPVADIAQARGERRLDQRRQRSKESGRPDEPPLVSRGLATDGRANRHRLYPAAAGLPELAPPTAVLTSTLYRSASALAFSESSMLTMMW